MNISSKFPNNINACCLTSNLLHSEMSLQACKDSIGSPALNGF